MVTDLPRPPKNKFSLRCQTKVSGHIVCNPCLPRMQYKGGKMVPKYLNFCNNKNVQKCTFKFSLRPENMVGRYWWVLSAVDFISWYIHYFWQKILWKTGEDWVSNKLVANLTKRSGLNKKNPAYQAVFTLDYAKTILGGKYLAEVDTWLNCPLG